MKILMVSDYYPPYVLGGAEISTKLLAEELSKKHDVHVLTPNYKENKYSKTKESKLTIHKFGSIRHNLYKKRRTSRSVYKKTKSIFGLLLNFYVKYSSREFSKNIEKMDNEYNFDIIHANNQESILGLSKVKTNAVKIAHLRDYRLLKSKINVDRFIAISGYVKNVYSKHGFPKSKISVVYNPLSSDDISKLSKSNSMKKTKTKNNSILFVGSLIDHKGVREIPKLSKSLPEYNITVIGEGPEEDYIKKNSSPNVRLIGFVSKNKLKNYYKANDILIVPSKWEEPFGRTVIEGQANGCLVIASSKGAIPELIKNGKNGIITKNFSKSIRNIKNSKRMVKMAIKKSKEYNVKNIASLVEQVYLTKF